MEKVCDKANALIGALRPLVSNVNDPTVSASKLYYGVWESVVLYAAPLWVTAVKRKNNRNVLKLMPQLTLVYIRSFTINV